MPDFAGRDYSYLLASKPVEVPGPMDLAGKGLTLGEMAQKLQMGGLQLEQAQGLNRLMQDPQMGPYLQLIFGAGTPGGMSAEAVQHMQQVGGPGMLPFLTQNVGLQEKTALMRKAIAEEAKARDEIKQHGLQNLSNSAAIALTNPTPQSVQSVVNQQKHLRDIGVSSEEYGGDLKDARNPQEMFDGLQGITFLKSDPKTQAEVAKVNSDIWSQQFKTRLDAWKETKGEIRTDVSGQAYVAPPPMAGGPPPTLGVPPGPTGPVGPAAGASPGAAVGSGGGAGGVQIGSLPNGAKIIQGPIVGATPKMLADVGTDADKMMKAATPEDPYGLKSAIKDVVSNIGGGLRKEKLAPQEEQNVKGAGEEVNSLVTKAQSANQMQALVVDMRNKEAQGILSGGVQGAPFFSKIANIAAAMGAKGDVIDKLQNTQAWSADSGHLIAQAVSQFAGARIAARELTFFENIKPALIQTPEGREQIYQALYNISDRIKQQAAQAQEYVNDPKNLGKGLGGFEPKFKEVKIPSLQVPGLPDPASRKGWTAAGDDGVTYKSDGARWVRQ